MFDGLLLMTHGGKTVYFGPVGENGTEFLEYANNLGYDMEEGRNIADFALEFSNGYSAIEHKRLRELEEAEDDPEEQPRDETPPKVYL